jgi:GTP-binding protein EngB required for normal cell division
VLCDIYSNNSSPLSNIIFENKNIIETSKTISSGKDNIYNFYLIDNDEQIIDLNGNDFSFTLVLFKQNDIFKLLKEYMKIQLLNE